jgi:hypothetical protein
VEVRVCIELGTEAVNETDRAGAGRGPGVWTVRARALYRCPQEQAQDRAPKVGIAAQQVAPPRFDARRR